MNNSHWSVVWFIYLLVLRFHSSLVLLSYHVTVVFMVLHAHETLPFLFLNDECELGIKCEWVGVPGWHEWVKNNVYYMLSVLALLHSRIASHGSKRWISDPLFYCYSAPRTLIHSLQFIYLSFSHFAQGGSNFVSWGRTRKGGIKRDTQRVGRFRRRPYIEMSLFVCLS